MILSDIRERVSDTGEVYNIEVSDVWECYTTAHHSRELNRTSIRKSLYSEWSLIFRQSTGVEGLFKRWVWHTLSTLSIVSAQMMCLPSRLQIEPFLTPPIPPQSVTEGNTSSRSHTDGSNDMIVCVGFATFANHCSKVASCRGGKAFRSLWPWPGI